MLGPPDEILTDNGKEYDSHEFRDACQQLGIKCVNSTRYHPETCGQVERMNASLIQVLRKYIKKNQRDLDEHVDAATYAVNTSPNAHSKFAPYILMFGMIPKSLVRTTGYTRNEEANDWKSILIVNQLREMAHEQLEREQREYKRKYDIEHERTSIRPGKWVMLRNHWMIHDTCRKLNQLYTGPYQVLKVHENNTVESVSHDQNTRAKRFNVKKLCEILRWRQ